LIDLRSDTVTLPTPEMREAIARAELGDDVYGEDPTVNRLESMAASMMGKDAALLVPSGTMGNLAAMLTHCARGTKAIVGSQSHTNLYEAGGASALGGIVLTSIANTEDGELDTHELARELGTPADDHFAQPSLVVIENTHNRCGGAPIKLSHMAEVSTATHRRKIPLHLDGARIFNAALALETTQKEIASSADTVSFCLSKGLGCPVGSILCGSREFIARAHRTRKVLGGGMRQAGIIAAAGIVALTTMVDRLAEDHQNARALAQGLALVAGLNVRPIANRTNMVVFDVDGDADASGRFAAALKERDVLISPRDSTSFRAVTHHGISRADIDRVVAAAAQATGEVFGD
jgi:threonine aldolase